MKNASTPSIVKWLLWALIATFVLGAYATYKYISFYRYVNAKKHEYIHQYNRAALFESLPTDTSDIIFLGNSLTEQFELAEFFNNAHVKNRGIGGDSVAGLLARLRPITASKPAKVFIEIGINDLSAGISVAEILHDYTAVITRLRLESPATRIYIQSVLPVSSAQEIPACREGCNDSVLALNAALRKLADGDRVRYVDMHTAFVDDNGGLADPLQTDGIHLSGKGYLLWAKIARPFVDE